MYSIMANAYPNDISKILGLTESANGIGIVANSALGSIIHKNYGFKATFLWNSFLYVTLGFITSMLLPAYLNSIDQIDEEE